MRFFPHGSGSIPGIAVSASTSTYAQTASFTTHILSASLGLTGSRGPTGPNGTCIYASGSQGIRGPSGSQGPIGTVDGPFESGY